MKKFVLAIVIISIIVVVGISITVAISDNINLLGIKVDDLQVYGETIKHEEIKIGGYISEDGAVVNDCHDWHSPKVLHFEAD